MLITDNLTGIVTEVPDEPIQEAEPPVIVPSESERIEALESAVLELILGVRYDTVFSLAGQDG